jgi:hypothetical protein
MRVSAPYHVQDRFGVTIAVAVLLRIDGSIRAIDIERLAHDLETTLVPLLGADEETPMGIAIRASEQRGIAENLILDAAVACPSQFEHSQGDRPTRTVIHFGRPQGGITN